MSILIKGIDIPEDIDELRLIINGTSIAIEPTKAIQIPTPHGRLIDRSVLFEEYQNLCNGLLCRDCPFFKENSCSIEEWILNQPPILEAEE